MSDSQDSMELDISVVDKCLRCSGDGSSTKLLVCSVIGCPIAIHEECMCSKPEIDENGRFYCPYCAHKRALVRAEKLRRKALKAKEVLSMFIESGQVNFPLDDVDEGPVGDRGEDEVKGGIEGGNEGEAENEVMEVEEKEDKGMDEGVSKGNSEQQCVSEGNGDNAGDGIDGGSNEENGGRSPGEEQVRLEAMEVPESVDFQRGSSPILRKRRYKMKAQKTVQIPHAIPLKIASSCRIDVVEEEENAEKQSEDDTISSSSSESGKVLESDKNEKGNASSKSSDIPELNQSEKAATSSKSGKSSELDRNEKATASLYSESRKIPVPSQIEKATKSRKVPESNQNEKATSSTEPKHVLESGREELFFHNKRRKINWTADELKMLKEGVEHYSSKVNKNLPWRKILDLGRHIFHETRTPSNLKDKWKLLCKEASKPPTKNKLDHLGSE
ncbi:uncharacterized protein LOC126797852 [Argentina anserina]|uniref:uncharacterized protein LOC126797852 n=1 Tax=Argentina anserina TaxID=57926 RepID=UPI00217692BE|nr:uncharacterized protein LOC126797852 [Potentilla anserina]XP_050380546.1 uncharacterized protein LOC126797852 [Potentilla anserina]